MTPQNESTDSGNLTGEPRRAKDLSVVGAPGASVESVLLATPAYGDPLEVSDDGPSSGSEPERPLELEETGTVSVEAAELSPRSPSAIQAFTRKRGRTRF